MAAIVLKNVIIKNHIRMHRAVWAILKWEQFKEPHFIDGTVFFVTTSWFNCTTYGCNCSLLQFMIFFQFLFVKEIPVRLDNLLQLIVCLSLAKNDLWSMIYHFICKGNAPWMDMRQVFRSMIQKKNKDIFFKSFFHNWAILI